MGAGVGDSRGPFRVRSITGFRYHLPGLMCRSAPDPRPIIDLQVQWVDGRPSAFLSLIQCPHFSVYLVLPWQPLSARLLFSPSQRPRGLTSLSTSIHTGSPWAAVPALLDRCGTRRGVRVCPGLVRVSRRRRMIRPCVLSALLLGIPIFLRRMICAVAPLVRIRFLGAIRPRWLTSRAPIQTQPATSPPCVRLLPRLGISARSFQSRVPIPMRSVISLRCAGTGLRRAILGESFRFRSTDPGGNCYLPPVCSDIAPPGYLGQTITVQNTDPGGMCYVTSLPPLCQGVAPVDYPGQVIPTQSTDRNDPCFVTALGDCTGHIHPITITYSGSAGPLDGISRPGTAIGGGPFNLDLGHAHPVTSDFVSDDGEVYSATVVTHSPAIPDPAGERSVGCEGIDFDMPIEDLCFDDAPPGYLGIVIPMQSTDPGAACFATPPPALAECTEIVVSDVESIAVTHGLGSTIGSLELPISALASGSGVPGLSIVNYNEGSGHSFWFGVSWPGHEGETVQVGAEVLDTAPNVGHPMVSRVHVMGESGWDFSQGSPYSSDRFVGPWVTDAFTNHRLIWVNTSQGHACFYHREAENYGSVGQSVGDLSLLPGSGFSLLENYTWCDRNPNSGDCGR